MDALALRTINCARTEVLSTCMHVKHTTHADANSRSILRSGRLWRAVSRGGARLRRSSSNSLWASPCRSAGALRGPLPARGGCEVRLLNEQRNHPRACFELPFSRDFRDLKTKTK